MTMLKLTVNRIFRTFNFIKVLCFCRCLQFQLTENQTRENSKHSQLNKMALVNTGLDKVCRVKNIRSRLLNKMKSSKFALEEPPIKSCERTIVVSGLPLSLTSGEIAEIFDWYSPVERFQLFKTEKNAYAHLDLMREDMDLENFVECFDGIMIENHEISVDVANIDGFSSANESCSTSSSKTIIEKLSKDDLDKEMDLFNAKKTRIRIDRTPVTYPK